MGNAAAIVASLEMTRGKFVTEIEKTNQDLGKLKSSATETGAAIAILDRQLASDKGNKVLQASLATLNKDLRETQREITVLEKHKKSLDAALGTPAPTAKLALPDASRARATVYRTLGADGYKPGGGGHGAGHGGGGNASMRNAELMHSGRAIGGELLAGVSPLQAFLVEAPRLFQAFAGSLGALLAPVAALAAGGALVGWLASAKKEARAMREETAMIGTNLGSVSGANAEVLEKALGEAVANTAKVREKFNSAGNSFVNGLSGGNGVQQEDVHAAEQQQQRIEQKLNAARGRDQGFAQRAFDGDESVEADKARLEFAQKRDEIYKRTTAESLDGAREEVNLAQQALDLKLAEIARAQEARRNETFEETQETSIRRYGKNVESELARAHLERRQADLANGPQEGPEYQHNVNLVNAAQTAKDEADKHQRERDADLHRRTRDANLRGSPDQIAYQRAVGKRDDIQGRLDDPGTKPDERKELEAQLAEAKAQVRDLAKQSDQKGFEFDKLGIQTGQVRGPQERLNAIAKELDLIERERKVNKEKNGDDAVANAQLDAQAHALRTEKEDIEHAEEAALTAAKAQTEEMQLQQSGQDGLARIEAIREQYQQRILEAQRLGKGELAEQLQLQQQMAMEQARMAAYFSTPGQQAAQRNRERAIAKAKERFDRDDGLQSIHRGMDGKPIDGYDPLLQRRRAFGDHSAYDPKTGAPLAGGDATSTKAAEAAGNDVDGDFNRRFHPGQGNVQPDRRQQAGADPQQKPADAAGDSAVLTELKAIHKTLDDKLDLKIP